MSISFSGLASGLDTSSWITSLTALKQAKVTELQEERENVLLSKETLNSIKSFFNSFRSTIEKITDTKFNIASMDLFAQRLAVSSNVGVLTATATAEAEENTYEILVDKLATNTQATSKYTYTTTIVETSVAGFSTKLTDLGMNIGESGSLVGFKVNGVERVVQLKRDDTISSLVEKLREVGVDSNYNDKTGVFTINIDSNDINDIDSTGIIDAFGLEKVGGGYKSNNLQIDHTDTIYSAATSDTLMSELGVKAGVVTINANDADYNVTINDSTTLGEFVADLNSKNIDATLDATGVFTLFDAGITNEGTTDILNALGMDVDIYSKSQQSNELTIGTVTTQSTAATTSTQLKDIGEGLVVNENDTIIVKNANNEYSTITVDDTTTIGTLIDKMNEAGLTASIDSDGNVTISDGTITGGTFDIVSAFNLNETVDGTYNSSNKLYYNKTISNTATESTQLSEFGITSSLSESDRTVKVYSAEGTVLGTITVTETMTLGDFVNSISPKMQFVEGSGIESASAETPVGYSAQGNSAVAEAELSGSVGNAIDFGHDVSKMYYGIGVTLVDGVLKIENGYIENTVLEESFGLERSSGASYVLGSIMTTTTSVAATGNTSLADIISNIGTSSAVESGYTLSFNGETLAVSSTSTLNDVITMVNQSGGSASLDSTGRLSINGGTLSGTVATALGFSSVANTVAVNTTGKALTTTKEFYADNDTKLSDIGITSRSFEVYDRYGAQINSYTLENSATIADFFNKLGESGIDATISNGVVSLSSADGKTIRGELATALGITSQSSTQIINTTSSSTIAVNHTGTITAMASSTLGELGLLTSGTLQAVVNDENLQQIATKEFDQDSTLSEIFGWLNENDIQASITDGIISLYSPDGNTMSGDLATTLGISTQNKSSQTTTIGVTLASTVKVTYTQTQSVTGTTKISDVVTVDESNSVIKVQASDNSMTGYVTITQNTTFDEFFENLSDYNVTASIRNNVITLRQTSGDVSYVMSDSSGTVLEQLGMSTVSTVTTTSTVGAVTTSSLQLTYRVSSTSVADETSSLSSLGLTSANRVMTVNCADGTSVSKTFAASDTIGTVFNWLSANNLEGSISDGVITISPKSGYEGAYVSGTLADGLGIGTVSQTVTTTVGKTVTSTAPVTYTTTQAVTGTTKISDVVSVAAAGSTIELRAVNATSTGCITITENTTFDDFFDDLADYNIVASISDNVITINQGSGTVSYAVSDRNGSVLQQLGISYTITSTSQTVGAVSTSTAAITYTSTVNSVATSETTLADLGLDTDAKRYLSAAIAGGSNLSFHPETTFTADSTLGDVMAWLEAEAHMNATMANGVITVTAQSGYEGAYLVGDLSNELGFQQAGFTTTVETGMSTTSTAPVTYSIMSTVTESTKLADLDGVTANGTLSVIIETPLTTVGGLSQDVGSDWTISDLVNWINTNSSCVASFTDGRIVIENNAGHYIEGDILEQMGIQVVTQEITTGTSQTSSAGLTYTTVTERTVTSYRAASSVITTLTTLPPIKTVGPHTIDGTMTSSAITGSVIAISTAQDLLNMQALSQNGTNFEGKTFILTGDITVGSSFTGIEEFRGVFDGNGHRLEYTITTNNSNGNDAGLFINLNGGTVKNITVDGSIGLSATYASYDNAGGIAAVAGNGARISNVDCLVDINGGTNGVAVGGLVGQFNGNGDIENCIVNNSITGCAGIGGLIGECLGSSQTRLTIEYCKANCDLYSSNDDEVLGGFIGVHSSGMFGIYYSESLCTFYPSNYTSYFGTFIGQACAIADRGCVRLYGCIDNCPENNNVSGYVFGISGFDTLIDVMGCISYNFSFNVADNDNATCTDCVDVNNMSTAAVNAVVNAYFNKDDQNLDLQSSYSIHRKALTHSSSPLSTISRPSALQTATADATIAELTNGDSQCSFIDGSIMQLIVYTAPASATATINISCTESTTLGELVGIINSEGSQYSITASFTNGSLVVESTMCNFGFQATGGAFRLLKFTDDSYIGATASTETVQATLTGLVNTTTDLGKLGLDDTGYMTLNVNGTTTVLAFNSSDTLSSMASQLSQLGISMSVSNTTRKVTIGCADTRYIVGMSSNLESALKMQGSGFTTTTISTINSNSDVLTLANTSATITTSTSLANLGINSDTYITVKNNGTTSVHTFTSSDTLASIASALNEDGITFSISDGKATIGNATQRYVTGMTTSLAQALNLNVGNGYTYTIQEQYTHGMTPSGTIMASSTTTVTATSSTTLGQLGMSLDAVVTIVSAGTTTMVTFTSSNTIDDVIQQLNAYGINASLSSSGLLTLGTANSDSYIYDATDSFKNVFNIETGAGKTCKTLSDAHSSISNSTTLADTTTMKILSMSTTYGELGLDSIIYGVSNGVNFSVTCSPDMTFAESITALAEYGIIGEITNGKLTLTPTANSYITGIESNGASTLQILNMSTSVSSYKTVGKTVVENTTSGSMSSSSTTLLTATGATTLGELGLSSSGTMSIVSDGMNVTLTLNSSNTLDDLTSQLSAYGINANVTSSGRLTLGSAGSDNYIVSISDSLKSALQINSGSAGRTYKTETVSIQTNSNSNALGNTTIVQSLTTSTTFGELGVNGTSTISGMSNGTAFSIQITSGKTLGEVLTTLSGYGIVGDITDGKLTLTPNNNCYITSSTSTAVERALKLGATGGIDKGYTTTVINSYTNTQSSSLKFERSNLVLNGDTKLGNIVNNTTPDGVLRIHREDGSYATITVSSSQTLNDFFGQISVYGLTGSVSSDGKVSITGNGNVYIENASSGGTTLLDALNMSDVNTFSQVTYTNKTSNVLKQTETVSATNTTKLEDLISDGVSPTFDASGNIQLVLTTKSSSGVRTTNLTFSKAQTIQDVVDTLASNGITARIDSIGRLSLSAQMNDFDFSGDLGSFLMGSYTKNYQTDSIYNSSTVLTQATVNVMTAGTKLSDLGITNGNICIVDKDNVSTTIAINTTTMSTIGDFQALLTQNGLTSNIDSQGRLSITGANGKYLANSADSASNILNVLGIAGATVGDVVQNSTVLTQTTVSKENVAMNIKLADLADSAGNNLGVTSGNINVYNNGVKSTLYIDADSTLNEIAQRLATYNISMGLDDGKVYIEGSGNSYITTNGIAASSATNLLSKIGLQDSNNTSTSTYVGQPHSTVTRTTATVGATRDTLLSDMGVSSGEYYIYNNGVKYTALISSDETLGSFMDTLESFGIQTSLTTGVNGNVLRLLGNGNSYVKKSNSTTNASNVVEKLFDSTAEEVKYLYSSDKQATETVTTHTVATLDTLLSEFDTPWGDTTLKAEGKLAVTVDGVTSAIDITADDTFGSLIEKFNVLGIDATLLNGELVLQSKYHEFSINAAESTSSLINPNAQIGLTYNADMASFVSSSQTVMATTTTVEERTLSVANSADMNTKLGLMNISDGTLSIYGNGVKATVEVHSDETFGELRTRIAAALPDVDIEFDDNGYLRIFSKSGGAVRVGATNDTSNIVAVCGFLNNESGDVTSARQLYKINSTSKITDTGLFRRGDVTEGTFTIGDAVFNITDTTTLENLISQINSSASANATAYWDSVDGKLVIKSRSTGASLINIEAGTSNFTDIMGYTTTERAADGSINSTKINTNYQEMGTNASFSINGTKFTSTSNTVGSDITRIKGVTLNLKGISEEGSSTTLTIEKDDDTLTNAVSDAVDAYNELIKNVDKEIAMGGTLSDQSTLKFIRNQIRSLMTSSIAGSNVFRNLDAVGISLDAANAGDISTTNINVLSFDKEKFIKAFDSDSEALKALLVGTDSQKGIFMQVESMLESALTSASGYFSSAEKSYTTKISQIDNKITKAQKSVERYRARLESKFSAMDMLIANMQNQYSSFLG